MEKLNSSTTERDFTADIVRVRILPDGRMSRKDAALYLGIESCQQSILLQARPGFVHPRRSGDIQELISRPPHVTAHPDIARLYDNRPRAR
jgi:hypothetical protein